MSCDYDVYCLDCNKRHYFEDANHRHAEMAAMVRIAPELKQFFLRTQTVAPDLLVWAFDDEHQARVNKQWFIEHGDHRLAVRDEYGKIDGDCYETFKCGECGGHLSCQLPNGHEGEHKGGLR